MDDVKVYVCGKDEMKDGATFVIAIDYHELRAENDELKEKIEVCESDYKRYADLLSKDSERTVKIREAIEMWQSIAENQRDTIAKQDEILRQLNAKVDIGKTLGIEWVKEHVH